MLALAACRHALSSVSCRCLAILAHQIGQRLPPRLLESIWPHREQGDRKELQGV